VAQEEAGKFQKKLPLHFFSQQPELDARLCTEVSNLTLITE